MGSEHVNLLNQFDRELGVTYRGDTYGVRDNGAVCRRHRAGRRKRSRDEIWTFGVASDSTGYMHFGAEVVHRIVATAFHGTQPSEKHIVDHIDTNRRNNRAENLRWITRLDNILLNPITRRRIEIAYGSVAAFIENPGTPLKPDAIRNYEWMRTVSKDEAQLSYESLQRWAASGKAPRGGELSEWVYGTKGSAEPELDNGQDFPSLTANVIQRNWKTPSAFELCPDQVSEDALVEYAARLEFGAAFSRNAFGESRSVVAEGDKGFLSVVCYLPDNPIKHWALTKITIENESFVHESIRSFFTLQGALKAHCSLLGMPFGESIDDYS